MNVLLIIAGILAMGMLVICIISGIENRKLAVTHYQILSPKLPDCFQNCRLVVLADLHNASFGRDNQRLIQAIQEQKPDYILITGDMIVGKPEQSTEVPAHLIRELAKQYPVYYAKGNHESRAARYPDTYGTLWQDYQEQIRGCVTWLDNEHIELTRGNASVFLYGLDLEMKYYKRFRHASMAPGYLKEKLGWPPSEGFRILLAHNPDYFPEYAEWGADLVLAGHLHGGMVRIPWLGGVISPMFLFFPKYDRGRYERDGHVMLLSGGLGNHTFKFRVNNLPELLVVELSNTEEKSKK